MISNFYRVDLHKKACVAISKSMMKHQQKTVWKSEGRLINLQAMHLIISLLAIDCKSTDNQIRKA
jgi:hypothetical protein